MTNRFPYVLFIALGVFLSSATSAQFLDPDDQKLLEYTDLEMEIEEVEDEEIEVQGDVFVIVDKMPEFPGGYDAMTSFLKRHMIYPDDAFNNSVEGKVYVSFIVLTDGTLDDFELVSGIGHGCDEEALRLATLMRTQWSPGQQMGHAVNVKYILTVPFTL
jgi:protein TonB